MGDKLLLPTRERAFRELASISMAEDQLKVLERVVEKREVADEITAADIKGAAIELGVLPKPVKSKAGAKKSISLKTRKAISKLRAAINGGADKKKLLEIVNQLELLLGGK